MYDMNRRFQMQGGKNWILPTDMNANRFFWDSHWLEIWSNHLCSSMGPNGGSVALDSARDQLSTVCTRRSKQDRYLKKQQTEKIETEVRDVDRKRITKVYACCPGWPSGGS
jgi:hypothetical protein